MGALASARAALSRRVGTYSGEQLASLSPVQLKFAEAAAAIDTAELLYRRRCEEMMATAEAGDAPAVETRAILCRDSAFGATQHAAMVWDMCAQNYGQIDLGGPPSYSYS